MLPAAVIESSSRIWQAPVGAVAAVPLATGSLATSSTVDDVEIGTLPALACLTGSKQGRYSKKNRSGLHF